MVCSVCVSLQTKLALMPLKKQIILLLFLFPFWLSAQKQGADTVCLSADEQKFLEMINQFRVKNKLPEIELSKSLTYVAQLHISDLQNNHPDTSICNTSSWSDKGKWTPCCYNKYVLKTECMWDKPKELTAYKFRGYEISYYEEGIIQADSLFALWKRNQEVSDMLLAKGVHTDKKWAAVGLALGDNYASLWLGQRPDPQGKPTLCRNERPEENYTKASNKAKQGRYYLIYGSFSMLKDAEDEVNKFKKAGFTNAQIVKNGDRIRVALGAYNSIREAMAAKEKHKDKYKDAWILKN